MEDLIDATPLLSDAAALKKAAEEQGTLFFRGLLAREDVLELRGQILSLCGNAGWLKEGTAIQDGIAKPGEVHVENEPAYMAVYDEVMKLEAFHSLAHKPGLTTLWRALFGKEVLAHPRNIARIVFPQAVQHTTPAHQDFIHIQGTENTWTSWIPLGDTPRNLGTLAVLIGSHREGLLPVSESLGAGGFGIDTSGLGHTWATADMNAGDVLIFHSHLIHKALPNKSETKLRLSVDFRFQPRSEGVAPSSLDPHFGRLSWDEIYAGWGSEELQYYWKRGEIHVASPEDLYGKLSRK